MTDNEIREHRDRQLVRRLGDTPDLAAQAVEAIAMVAGSYDPVDANLFARRLLEAELGAGPDGVGEHVYREAAGTLRAAGHPAEAEALRMIADTSTVLAAASVEWHGRFLARPETQTERDARRLVRDSRDAVRRLRELLGGNAEVAQLCGITTATVRSYVAAVPGVSAVPDTSPGGGDGDAS